MGHKERGGPASVRYESTTVMGFQTNPLMIRLDTKAGHGAGKPTSRSIEEYTDIFCFLIKALGIEYR